MVLLVDNLRGHVMGAHVSTELRVCGQDTAVSVHAASDCRGLALAVWYRRPVLMLVDALFAPGLAPVISYLWVQTPLQFGCCAMSCR
jgi:hypothetical protein